MVNNHRETTDSYLLGKALRNFCDFNVWLIALIYKRKTVSMNTYGKQGVLNISWLGGAINWSSLCSWHKNLAAIWLSKNCWCPTLEVLWEERVKHLQTLPQQNSQIWLHNLVKNRFDPFELQTISACLTLNSFFRTPKISLVILLIISHTVHVMLVWRIWYWIIL